jgi:Protein of unknown function (DUF982)
MARLEDRPFAQAVKVHGARAALVEHIGSVRKAAEWLLYQWPAQTADTPKARDARQACLEALEDETKVATARQAFREAAEEAGILIGDDNRPPPKPMKRKR